MTHGTPRHEAPFRVEPLGRMAVFLLPSLKLKQKKLGKSYEEIVHHFLMKHFAGYTASAGNIFGFWRDDETGRQYYGEHKQYKVSFRGKDRVAMVHKFLSQLAGELNEDCIYLEYGEDAWLIYAKAAKPSCGGRDAQHDIKLRRQFSGSRSRQRREIHRH